MDGFTPPVLSKGQEVLDLHSRVKAHVAPSVRGGTCLNLAVVRSQSDDFGQVRSKNGPPPRGGDPSCDGRIRQLANWPVSEYSVQLKLKRSLPLSSSALIVVIVDDGIVSILDVVAAFLTITFLLLLLSPHPLSPGC